MDFVKTSVLAAAALVAAPLMPASTTVSNFGRMPDGTVIKQYTLTNRNGLVCKVITYGATITEVDVPDRGGKLGDVVLGFPSLDGYLGAEPFFGATVGRVANRIAHGQFTLGGETYKVPLTDGPHSLHGGIKGFDKVVWGARALEGSAVELTYLSPDGDQGYPGNLRAIVRFTLADDNRLRIDYEAEADQATPVNLTNHSYWNLGGGGSILGERVTIRASRYTPVDSTLIPTGEIAPVAGGPMDFTTAKPVGRDLKLLTNHPQGYDHNFVIDRPGDLSSPIAEVDDAASGRVLTVYTDQPGVQFYTGNFLDGKLIGKNGQRYGQYGALCLETQHFPDSVNHPNFPSTILHPRQVYHTTTIYAFSTR